MSRSFSHATNFHKPQGSTKTQRIFRKRFFVLFVLLCCLDPDSNVDSPALIELRPVVDPTGDIVAGAAYHDGSITAW